MVKPTPRAETLTANYGWTKPEVGASVDDWGGYINTDLDGIDATVKGVSVVANAAYQVAAVVMGDNRIINGDMRIDQRNAGASGTAGGYTVDRWQYGSTLANKVWWGRNINSGSAPAGFPYYLGIGSQAAYTLLATDYFFLKQVIEADTASDFAWGTPNAQSVTLSFWAYSSLTGIFSGSIQGGPTTRSYPFTYSLPTANIWTKIVVTIPGDTNAAWAASMSGNGSGPQIIFDVGSGSNFRGPANAWVSANYVGATGANSIFSVGGAIFYVTGVKLEIGSVATPYNRQSLAKSMADCQRYYQVITGDACVGFQNAASFVTYDHTTLMSAMRATPTVGFSNISASNASGLTTSGVSPTGYISAITVTGAGQASALFTSTFNAEL